MTKQEIFDKIWQYFIVEKHERSVDQAGNCTYRHPSGDGRRCAAGLLILDEHYTSDLEGDPAGAQLVCDALMKSGIDMNDASVEEFVVCMQYVHDVSSGEFVDEAHLRRKGVECGVRVPLEG